MNRKVLHDLLERYTANQCSPEEQQLVEHWYELIGETRDLALTDADWQLLENRIWAKLNPDKPETTDNIQPLWGRIFKVLAGMAAAAVLVLGFYFYQNSRSPENKTVALVTVSEQAKWKSYSNETTKARLILLPDGSKISLDPQSQLAVSTDFNLKNREVRLLGQATFDVAKNPAMPFMLYCGEMVTKVLGTRFKVRATSLSEPMEVTVQTGKVTVYRDHPEEKNTTAVNNGVILTPNQKATYYPDHQQFVASLTDKPQPVAPVSNSKKENAFVFEETPLTEIIQQLQEVYGIEIELEQESIANCPFTGNLANQDLYSKLELLCGSVNGSYEVRGTKILVMGKGCSN